MYLLLLKPVMLKRWAQCTAQIVTEYLRQDHNEIALELVTNLSPVSWHLEKSPTIYTSIRHRLFTPRYVNDFLHLNTSPTFYTSIRDRLFTPKKIIDYLHLIFLPNHLYLKNVTNLHP